MKTAIVLAIMATLGGGTSIAAEQSSPGDTLYPVKVGVNERVSGAFNVRTEARARHHVSLAERRMEEAARLGARGELTLESRQNIETRLDRHIRAAQEHISTLEAQGEVHAAASVASEFESTLNAYAHTLSTIEGEAQTLAVQISSKARSASQTRMDLEASVGAEADVEVAARGALEATRNTIRSTEQVIAETETQATVKSRAEAEAELEAAQELVVEGEVRMEAGAYNEAFVTFQEAQRTAQEARHILQIGIDLDTGSAVDIDINGAREDSDDEDKTDEEEDSTDEDSNNTDGEESEEDGDGVRVDTEVETEGELQVP